jgi:hypothetical protein
MKDAELKEIEDLVRDAISAMAASDAKKLKNLLRTLAKLATTGNEHFNAILTPIEKQSNKMASACLSLGHLLHEISRVLDFPNNKAISDTKAFYRRPLTFGKKWNGRSPASFPQKLAKRKLIQDYLMPIIEAHPDIAQTKLVDEITAKFKIQSKDAHALVKQMQKLNK